MKSYSFVFVIVLLLMGLNQDKNPVESKKVIQFKVSSYNLLFTTVEINRKEYTALIDFGDFAEFQLSTTLIEELGLETEKSELIMSDVDGNQYALEKGRLNEILVDGILEKNVTFYSAKNEIESVSEQVGTEFHATIGIGYFLSKNFILDFNENHIELLDTHTIEMSDFTNPINSDFGYMIGQFTTTSNDSINLLFDTGSPISKIDLNQINFTLKDSTVNFQHFNFPSKILKLKSNHQTLTLNMENENLSSLQPLDVVGIFGVNDMKGKVFYFNNEGHLLRINDGLSKRSN